MHRRSIALSSLAIAFASTGGHAPLRTDRLDGRVGRREDGSVGLAAAGAGEMSPHQLVARSSYLARKRQTHPGKRRGRR